MMRLVAARLPVRLAALAAVALLLLVTGRAAGSSVPHIHSPPWLWTDLKPIGDGDISYKTCDPYLPASPNWSYGVENWDTVMGGLMDFDQYGCSLVDPPLVQIRYEDPDDPRYQCKGGVYGCWTFPQEYVPPPWRVGIILFVYDVYNPYSNSKKTAAAAHEWGHMMDLASVTQQNCIQPYRIMGGNENGVCILGPSGLEAWTVADLHGWSSHHGDTDGFSDAVELYVGTDPNDRCPDNPSDAAWPLDIDNDREISVTGDVFEYVGCIGATPGSSGWWQRLDLSVDEAIDVADDVFSYVGKIGLTCT